MYVIAFCGVHWVGSVPHPTKPGTVTVSGKASLDVPPGTLNSVLKQAGLKKQE